MYKMISRLLPALLLTAFCSAPALAQYMMGRNMFEQNQLNRAAYQNWLAYQRALSNGRNLRQWWKTESTVGLAFTGPLEVEGHNHYHDRGADSSSSYRITGRPQLSISANGNSNHLLARLSGNSILSLSIGEQLQFFRWKYQTLTGFGKLEDNTLYHLQVGVPITIDYKMGGDVDFDPDQRVSVAVGGGVMPFVSGTLTSFVDAQGSYRIAPTSMHHSASMPGAAGRSGYPIRPASIPS